MELNLVTLPQETDDQFGKRECNFGGREQRPVKGGSKTIEAARMGPYHFFEKGGVPQYLYHRPSR